MSYSGADPDALAAYAAQTIDAAESLRPLQERLAVVEGLLRRALPRPPSVKASVQGFTRLTKRTRELGERAGRFGLRLRDAMDGPTTKRPMAMDGLLFPARTGSPPRPVGWAGWSSGERARYLRAVDPQVRAITIANPYDIGRVARDAGKGLVNGVLGSADGIANTLTFGLAPDIPPAFRDGDQETAFTVGRFGGTIATGVAVPVALARAVPVLGTQTAAGFVARRGVDVAVGAASDASLDRHHTPGSMTAAGLTGGLVGGVVDGVASAYTAARIAAIEPPTIPHGFDSIEAWEAFARKAHEGLAAAGYPEARAAVQGSGATGVSFRTGEPFDVGRLSDIDLAVASAQLLRDAAAAGAPLRSGGMRTAPLSPGVQRLVDIADTMRRLSDDAGRPVHVMVYGSLPDAVGHKPSIPLPKE